MPHDTGDTQVFRSDFLKAGLLAIAAAGLFAGMNLSVRALGQMPGPALPAIEITFFRFLFGLLTASFLLVIHGRKVLTTRIPGAHLVRVLAGAGGVTMMFAALASLPVGYVPPSGVTAVA